MDTDGEAPPADAQPRQAASLLALVRRRLASVRGRPAWRSRSSACKPAAYGGWIEDSIVMTVHFRVLVVLLLLLGCGRSAFAAEVRVVSLVLGDQVEAERLPLPGAVYDDKNDMIEIAP